MMLQRPFFFGSVLLAIAGAADVNELGQECYDIDSSWAIKSTNLSTTFGNKQALYNDFMEGCRQAVWADGYEEEEDESNCNDDYRIFMNTKQPMGMRNYTRLGFEKIKAPERVFKLLKDFWEDNKNNTEMEWDHVNTYHNMWGAPPTIANIQNTKFKGGGPELRMNVWEAAKDMLEEWTGKYLSYCSIWGIRVYHNGSILAPHVDRSSLVTSAIINVDQDVEEPWPLEVWGHDGKPYNITMEPGEIVLYESHSLIHGRPFPLNGNAFANLFVHYEVIGTKSETGELYFNEDDLESREAGLPPYIIPGSEWAHQWRHEHPNGWELYAPINPVWAAGNGDLKELQIVSVMNKTQLVEKDRNGWQPIHIAARAGQVDAVKFLLERGGADVNAPTFGKQTPLDIAVEELGKDHPMCEVLREAGGTEGSTRDEEL